MVDFGENYALGLYEKSRPWNILIKGNDAEKIVSLSNKAIATSGGYGTSFEPTLRIIISLILRLEKVQIILKL